MALQYEGCKTEKEVSVFFFFPSLFLGVFWYFLPPDLQELSSFHIQKHWSDVYYHLGGLGSARMNNGAKHRVGERCSVGSILTANPR